MYSTFDLLVAIILSALSTAACSETLHFIKDRKKGRR